MTVYAARATGGGLGGLVVVGLLLMVWGVLAAAMILGNVGEQPTAVVTSPVLTPEEAIWTGWTASSDGFSDGKIIVQYGAHAIIKHGDEGEAARKCFEENGTLMVFHFRGTNHFARVCVTSDQWVALQFLIKIGERTYQEATSYIPHLVDRTPSGVRDRLLEEGWTLFKGGL